MEIPSFYSTLGGREFIPGDLRLESLRGNRWTKGPVLNAGVPSSIALKSGRHLYFRLPDHNFAEIGSPSVARVTVGELVSKSFRLDPPPAQSVYISFQAESPGSYVFEIQNKSAHPLFLPNGGEGDETMLDLASFQVEKRTLRGWSVVYTRSSPKTGMFCLNGKGSVFLTIDKNDLSSVLKQEIRIKICKYTSERIVLREESSRR